MVFQVPQLATVCRTIRCASFSLPIASLNILTVGRWRRGGPAILPYFNLTFLGLRRSLIATLLPREGGHRINALLGDANGVLKDILLRFSQLCTNARLALSLRFQCDQEEQSLVDARAHFCDVSIRREKPRTCGTLGQDRPLQKRFHCPSLWCKVRKVESGLLDPKHTSLALGLPPQERESFHSNKLREHSLISSNPRSYKHIPRLTDFPTPVSVDGCLHFPLSVSAEFWRRGLGTSRY